MDEIDILRKLETRAHSEGYLPAGELNPYIWDKIQSRIKPVNLNAYSVAASVAAALVLSFVGMYLWSSGAGDYSFNDLTNEVVGYYANGNYFMTP